MIFIVADMPNKYTPINPYLAIVLNLIPAFKCYETFLVLLCSPFPPSPQYTWFPFSLSDF